ncbi:NAD(P)-dependent alcohol dehydrogenase [Spirochaeta cellobiosiphila]|uniref:NAD(P)-dependent alcohol dehydrogenase n=1 Tax=Spirochaeta cellobiosiphila TaxID=504483 RepID=UPI00041F9E2F|nr:NAD(P)-dependent alcohol dehydrogenase [Spirochaeta cellobiosiphila]
METITVKAYGTEGQNQPLKDMTIPRRTLGALDIEMDILYCGICHSDLHWINDDFGATTYPIVPGHEIVGRITKVGTDVTDFKIGDKAAIGCIADSCGHCQYCEDDLEMFCEEGATISFNSSDKHLGGVTYGGFAQSYVCDSRYVLHMPEGIDLAAGAPLLCAGITVYSPLRHWKVGPGKVVGILGIGGLGHVAIKIAKAMGAHVVVFTSSPSKVDDTLRLGADQAVLSTDESQMKNFGLPLDMILDTISAKHNINSYLNYLRPDGSIVLVGLPPEALEVGAFSLVHGRRSLSGSNIGGIAETQEMLDFCGENNITADIELINVSQINEAFKRLEKGDVKYRFVIDMSTL